jgi:threonine dehydrogenase-like Zn-dependent dehydrogenase
MPEQEDGRRMGHEFIGVVEDVGAEVSTLECGDLVVAPFVWAYNTCDSAVKACTPRAATAAGGARRVWMPARVRPFAFRKHEARWSSCPSPRNRH